MSTHSAECIPHEPSPGELVQRTLIRKTSLLRKIEPIARRSGFANRIIYNPHLLQTLVRNRRERRNDPEIVKDAHGISMRPNSDRSPLYDVRKHAVHVRLNDACELMFRGRIKPRAIYEPGYAKASARQPSLPACQAEAGLSQRRLVEPDGIEPTTSCLQSTRSPS